MQYELYIDVFFLENFMMDMDGLNGEKKNMKAFVLSGFL